MSESQPLLAPHQIKSLHRGALLCLVAIAIAIAIQPSATDSVPPATLSAPALALGLAMVFARALSQSRKMPERVRPWLFVLGLLCAVLVGLLGLVSAVQDGAMRAGLGFTLGALILALRPPRFPVSESSEARAMADRDRPGS